MRNRLWRRARTAVAVAVGLAAFAAGGALTVAGPASAAGAPASAVIDISNGQFDVILSNPRVAKLAAAEDNVTAFHGFSTFQVLTIQSQGFDLEGRIQGTLRSYNFESLWQVYNLPKSSGWKVWALSFKKDSSQSVLKETFRREELIDLQIDIRFRVSAAALHGVSTLRIGFETLRLSLNGTTKDFTVVNGASGGAKDQDGDDVPIDFEPL